MTIDPDVGTVAKQWGLPATLLQAVVQAEGDLVRAVQCSIPSVTTRAEALEVLARSCTHRMAEFLVVDRRAAAFVTFFGSKWAPVGVANDPRGLNLNWAKNVLALWAPDRVK